MASNVNTAFDFFLKNVVRISKDRSDLAKISKSNLIRQIQSFPSDGRFPVIHPDVFIDYGSFSRKTKIKPLDDIDLMVILDAEGGWRSNYFDVHSVHIQQNANRLISLCNDGTNTLNSIKVLNKFKDYLFNVSHYKKAEIKRNHEAITLSLNSYEWTYDIVPCFVTQPDENNESFFLIPDGKGNWKCSDPRIDKLRTQNINSDQTVSVLDIIRIFKYWTKRPTMPTISSYFLENLILKYYSENNSSYEWIDWEIPKVLAYIYHNIGISLSDPKGFCANINNLTIDEQNRIREKARVDYFKAEQAIEHEKKGDMKGSIDAWREIFGNEFPIFS